MEQPIDRLFILKVDPITEAFVPTEVIAAEQGEDHNDDHREVEEPPEPAGDFQKIAQQPPEQVGSLGREASFIK